jgi:TRAP-type C4-dicarboxylate transport system permease small subunit
MKDIKAKHPLIRAYLDFLNWVNRGVRLVGGILLVLMSISVFGSVASRYLSNMSWAWIEEGSLFLMVWVVVLGTTLAIEAKHMIAVEAFASLFSGKSRKILKTVVSLAALFFIVILIVSGWKMALLAEMQYSITIDWLSMFWVYLAIPVGGCFMLLNLLGNLIKLWTMDDQVVSEVLE